MRRRSFLPALGVLALGLGAAAGPASAQPREGHDRRPDGGRDRPGPRPIPEPRFEEPGRERAGHGWRPGHWQWRRNDYAWSPGRHERRRENREWEQPRWDRRGDRDVWVGGRWR